MKVTYVISTELGISDVLEFDTYEDALKAAEKWHEETGLVIEITKIVEESVKKVGK